MRSTLAAVISVALLLGTPAVTFAAAGPAASAPDANGKCHDAKGKFTKCPPASPAKVCKKGKPCGKSCIAQDKVCHKPA